MFMVFLLVSINWLPSYAVVHEPVGLSGTDAYDSIPQVVALGFYHVLSHAHFFEEMGGKGTLK
jgi:hypothetical protein